MSSSIGIKRQLYLLVNLEISASCISFGSVDLEGTLKIIIRNELVEYMKQENREIGKPLK